MSKYLILIYGDEQRWDAMSAQEMDEISAGHREFRVRAGEASIIASGQLDASDTTVTVRAGAEGVPMTTDGPFLETKEVVGGFYVIEAATRDDAVALASGLTEATHDHSAVEVVPLVQ